LAGRAQQTTATHPGRGISAARAAGCRTAAATVPTAASRSATAAARAPTSRITYATGTAAAAAIGIRMTSAATGPEDQRGEKEQPRTNDRRSAV